MPISLPPVLLLLILLLTSCAPAPAPRPTPLRPAAVAVAELLPDDPIAALLDSADTPEQSKVPLGQLGYTIQVGAFAQLDNAVRLERRLDGEGLEAFYFRHESGLYKVRFGNYPGYREAKGVAQRLQTQGVIDAFYVVEPREHAAVRIARSGQGDLRQELVRTAQRFLGVPYRWGGNDSEEGFDCSGLTLACYRLNGLNLPRISRDQFVSGRWVARDLLRPGDLVFFATRGGRRVTHVGLYIGANRFIHAPRTGQTVRVEQLDAPFYARTYVGGRSYF